MGKFPESLAAPHLDNGSFVRISDVHLDMPRYQRCWKLDSLIVARVTDALRSAAGDPQPARAQIVGPPEESTNR